MVVNAWTKGKRGVGRRGTKCLLKLSDTHLICKTWFTIRLIQERMPKQGCLLFFPTLIYLNLGGLWRLQVLFKVWGNSNCIILKFHFLDLFQKENMSSRLDCRPPCKYRFFWSLWEAGTSTISLVFPGWVFEVLRVLGGVRQCSVYSAETHSPSTFFWKFQRFISVWLFKLCDLWLFQESQIDSFFTGWIIFLKFTRFIHCLKAPWETST